VTRPLLKGAKLMGLVLRQLGAEEASERLVDFVLIKGLSSLR